jgi:hypothetical protein
MPKYHLPILPILLVLIVVAVVVWRKYPAVNNLSFFNSPISKLVTPSALEVSPSPIPTLVPSPLKSSSPSASVLTSNVSVSLKSSSSNNSADFSLDSFIYPSSQTSAKSSSEALLLSGDETNKITAWYKDRITSLKFNAKSFVNTNTNGNVNNKLVASNGQTQVTVEITKGPTDSQAKIKVILSTT